MEPDVIYSGVIGLLVGLAAAIIAGAVGYALGRRHEREEVLPQDVSIAEDPAIQRLLREREHMETRRVPSYRTHGGSAVGGAP